MDKRESDDSSWSDESEPLERLFGDFLSALGLAAVVAAVVVTVSFVVLVGAARAWWGR